MTAAIVAEPASVSVRRALFDMVADGVGAGLPVPRAVDVNEWTHGGTHVQLWMAAVDDLAPWVQHLGLTWQPIRIFAGSQGGWQWSVPAVRVRHDEHDQRDSVRAVYTASLDVEGPVFVPGWLRDVAGVDPADPVQE